MKTLIALTVSTILVCSQVMAAPVDDLGQISSDLKQIDPQTLTTHEKGELNELQQQLSADQSQFPTASKAEQQQMVSDLQQSLKSFQTEINGGGQVAGGAGTATNAAAFASTATLITLAVGTLAALAAIIGGATNNNTPGTTASTSHT